MEVIFGSVTIPICTGLAWLAYQHHEDFGRIAKVLMALSTMVVFVAGIFSYAANYGARLALTHSQEQSTLDLQEINSLMPFSFNHVAFISIMFAVYVAILWTMPYFINLDDK
ncbi:hypothetical protein [Roseibium polysiphoniae]|uniref:Uncharacterized protein n=1 Tax=Roseibium polysiphoniae TaxID=2571221 RepID=A0ABR9C6P9_9HYPH|nr:hypothetical protein [Roseibium polysiphoniae]MBD8875447.1 hypothetical protein [Roseibium polysiphoniae]